MARRAWRALALTLALSGAPVPAHAQDWMAGAFAGAAHSQPAAVRLEEPGTVLDFNAVAFEGRSLESPIYYGYRVSRRVASGSAIWIEGELIHLKVYARTDGRVGRGRLGDAPASGVPMAEVIERLSISHGLNLVLANVVVRKTVGRVEGPLRLAARAGGGPTVPHAESEVRGRIREGYELDGPAVQVSGGVEVRVRRRLFLTAEYKFTGAAVSVHTAGGELSTRVWSHHAAFGLALGF